MSIITLLNAIIEGHWEIISKEFLINILGVWFDEKGGIFCDLPMANLLLNSHLGKLGRPLYPNTKKLKRITYKAKQNNMYMDYFVFDNCEAYFNWFPSIGSTNSYFEDIKKQLIAIVVLDRIHRNDWNSDSHPFRGAALFPLGSDILSKETYLPERLNI